MKRRNFLSQISLSTVFLGLIPLKKLFAFTSLNQVNTISNIPASQQIRHGALFVNKFETNTKYHWFQSVQLQTFLANGISQSNRDLQLLSIKLEGIQVHLSAIENQIIVNYNDRECKLLLTHSTPSELELPEGYFLKVVDIKDASMNIPCSDDVKVICLTGEAHINDVKLKQGQMLDNIFDHHLQIHAPNHGQLCIVGQKS